MNECRFVPMLIGLALSGQVAAELENTSLDTSLSYGYGSDINQSMQGVVDLAPELEWSFGEGVALVTSARVRLDAQDELEPGEPTLDNFAPASRPLRIGDTGTAELRDFYFEFRSDNGLTRLGKQQIVWGRLDGIKVLDLVNPQSFREFIMDDFGNSRIGLWSAYFDYSFGAWRTELAVIADGSGHEIPDTGAWFALTAPRFRYGATANQPAPAIVTESRGHSADDSAVGIRLSRSFGRLETSAVAYTGIDPEPLGRFTTVAGEIAVERFYDRRDVFGFSAECGFGSVVLRGEYAFQPDRVFNRRAGVQLDISALDQHRAAIGLDVNGPLGFFINLQYLVDLIDNAPADLVRPKTDRVGTLYIRRSFAYDALTLEARWYRSFEDGDDLAALQLEYEFGGETSLLLAAESFSGSETGLFGQFEQRDRIVLGFKHTF